MTYDVNVSFSVPAGSEREAFELMTTVLNRAGRCRLMRAEHKSIIESSIVSEPIAEDSETCRAQVGDAHCPCPAYGSSDYCGVHAEAFGEYGDPCAVPDCGGFTHAKGANYCEDHKNS